MGDRTLESSELATSTDTQPNVAREAKPRALTHSPRYRGPTFSQVMDVIEETYRLAEFLPAPPPRRYGRIGYSATQLLVAHIAGMGLGIRSAHHLARELKARKGLRSMCGFIRSTPHASTLLRFERRRREDPALRDLADALERLLYRSAVPRKPHIARFEQIMAVIDDGPLLDALDREWRPGRTGYPPRAMWRAYCAVYIFECADLAVLCRNLASDPELAESCGFTDRLPSRSSFARFVLRLAEYDHMLEAALAGLVDAIHELQPDYGKIVAIDSTVVPTFANPRHKPPADSEADFGFKTANRGRERSELQLGYRAHFAACADTELPLAWKLTKASRNDSPELRPLLDAVLLGFANLLRAAPQLA